MAPGSVAEASIANTNAPTRLPLDDRTPHRHEDEARAGRSHLAWHGRHPRFVRGFKREIETASDEEPEARPPYHVQRIVRAQIHAGDSHRGDDDPRHDLPPSAQVGRDQGGERTREDEVPGDEREAPGRNVSPQD